MPVGSVTGLIYRRGRNIPRVVDYQYPGMGVVDTARYLAGQALRPVQYMTPGVGDWMAHQDAVEKYGMAGQAWDEGRVLDAAMHGAGGLVDDLTTVPVLGDAAMLAKGLGAGIGKMAPAFAAITAYHGTPHRLPPTEKNPLGEFDLSKIGTGEGAQAYGHGLYLAEHPDVAKSYTPRDFDAEKEIYELYKGAEKRMDYEKMEIYEAAMLHDTPSEIRARYSVENGYSKGMAKKAESVAFTLERIGSKQGSFYTVDLPDEHIEKMLDWDAPFSKQPKNVQNAILDIVERDGNSRNKNGLRSFLMEYGGFEGDTGQGIYYAITKRKMNSPELASRELRKRGVPGLKYFDQMSRTDGAGTRNFVIFDPDIAKIIGRE